MASLRHSGDKWGALSRTNLTEAQETPAHRMWLPTTADQSASSSHFQWPVLKWICVQSQATKTSQDPGKGHKSAPFNGDKEHCRNSKLIRKNFWQTQKEFFCIAKHHIEKRRCTWSNFPPAQDLPSVLQHARRFTGLIFGTQGPHSKNRFGSWFFVSQWREWSDSFMPSATHPNFCEWNTEKPCYPASKAQEENSLLRYTKIPPRSPEYVPVPQNGESYVDVNGVKQTLEPPPSLLQELRKMRPKREWMKFGRRGEIHLSRQAERFSRGNNEALSFTVHGAPEWHS